MHKIGLWILDDRYLIHCKDILKVCGLAVQKFVQNKRIILVSFTHFAQPVLFAQNNASLFTFSSAINTHSLHNKCIQILSVRIQFYTFYTGPITTTI